VNPPVIVAGECEPHIWCATCQASTRVRLTLHGGDPDGPLLAVVEVCPGCGANHATPNVQVTPQPQPRSLLAKLRREPVPEMSLCAYGGCRRRGSREHEYTIPSDSGTYRYIFCKPAHRAAWAAENGLRA
jgi:hypothetical protein